MVGGLSFFSFGTTKLTLRKYLDGLAVGDELSKTKYKNIMEVINNPSSGIKEFRDILFLHRYQDKTNAPGLYRKANFDPKRTGAKYEKNSIAPMTMGWNHFGPTTGEKILDALLSKGKTAPKVAKQQSPIVARRIS